MSKKLNFRFLLLLVAGIFLSLNVSGTDHYGEGTCTGH